MVLQHITNTYETIPICFCLYSARASLRPVQTRRRHRYRDGSDPETVELFGGLIEGSNEDRVPGVRDDSLFRRGWIPHLSLRRGETV